MARQLVSTADVFDFIVDITAADDATTEVIAAPASNQAIRVLGYVYTVTTDTTVQWKSGTTAKSGVMTVPTGIASQGADDSRAFQCAGGQALNVDTTGAVTLGGHGTYQLVEVPN